LIDQNSDLTVGGNPGGYGFNSNIDDVRIYDYARTQKQIAEDMNAGHPSVGSPVGSYAAWWKFDEGYGNSVHDMSVNANTGTNHGASWTNDGKFGKALSFNGTSSYVSVIGNANFTSPTGYTWSAWINQTSLTDYQAIMSHSDTTACEDFTFYTSANGTLTFGVDGTGCGQQGYGGLSSSAGAISVNKWYHIVGVADFSNTYKTYLYINGQLVTSRDATGINPVNRAMNFSIGRSYDGGGVNTWYFNGLIDEVKVYPFALTADDVKTEYNRGSALKMGSVSDTSGLSGGSIASNSASAAYCIPGDTASCNSPVGEWKFDDHTGTYANDTSGNNNNGSLGGGTAGYMPTWQSSSSCHSGSCLKFDGTDDYIDMGNGASLSPTANGITVEAWVYRTATLTGGYRWDIVAKSGWCGGSYSMGIDSPTNNVEDYVTVNGSCVGMDGSLFPMNQWVHEVMTAKAGGKLIAYINGIDVAETSLAAGTLNDNSNSLKINGYSFGQDVNPANLQGMIDNVTIYNYARTPAQIAWDYNRGKPVGWWKFDECQGTTAYDSSGNGNTGTISIGATGSQTTAGTCLTPTNGTGAWYNGKTGKFNSALSFDGADDYVRDAGSSTSLPYSSQAHSGFAWIYPTSNNTANNGVEIFDRNCNNTGVMWGLSISNGTLFFHGGADDFSSSLTVPLNQWSYVGYTYNGNTSTTVYLNNQSQTGTISQQLNVPLATNFSIGAACYFGYFAGKIDDVKIYNYALTPQQILLDYNQGSAVRFGPISGRP